MRQRLPYGHRKKSEALIKRGKLDESTLCDS